LDATDLTACDREPIHIPGSIQPHGAMLVIRRGDLKVAHQAGATLGLLGLASAIGMSIDNIFGDRAGEIRDKAADGPGVVFQFAAAQTVDLTVHLSGDYLIVEIEQSSDHVAHDLVPRLEAAATRFERATTLSQLCVTAAHEFRQLCGYDRVMVYRFLDDGAGVVMGEALAEGEHSFMNHHFPASDIPRQARALYVRNLTRVIPDIGYEAAPLDPPLAPGEELDMSDSVLRSVSPVHLQYMKNMGVGASASISIVRDGVLWGLIACHNRDPRAVGAGVRIASRALAGTLSRQIRAREDTDTYRERVRLRTFEDDIVALLSREGSLEEAISKHLSEIMRMLDGDGLAIVRGEDLVQAGRCPSPEAIRKLASWLKRKEQAVYSTSRLGDTYDGEACGIGQDGISGLLALTLSRSEPWLVMWFRGEKVEVVKWAGNPHKNEQNLTAQLTPRASFEAWSETVRGRSRPWSLPEIEAAGRLRFAVTNVWQNRRIQDLNRDLLSTLDQKELLLDQKEFLLREVNHRVQNSLQLVESFLSMQRREAEEGASAHALDEARRRISAVSLVHRRLYRSDQLEIVDAARYFDELLDDLTSSLGDDWTQHVVRDLEPVMLKTDRAVALGLILTELFINANKYAYGGEPGPLAIRLDAGTATLKLSVADQGVGHVSDRKGFGSRMIKALASQLAGEIVYSDNAPGTLVVLTAPVE
jgi:two-component system, chemotaxis family, sensor kinase Cph1